MKLLLQHREENVKVFLRGRTIYNQLLATSLKGTQKNLKKLANFFKSQSTSIQAIWLMLVFVY